MEYTVELISGILLFIVFGLVAFTPYYSKQDILFGYRISSELSEHPEVRKLKRNFVIYMLTALSVLGLAILLERSLFWIFIPVFLLVQLAAFLTIRNRAKVFVDAHKEEINFEKKVVVSTVPRGVGVSAHWFWIPFGLIVLIVAIGFYQYGQLPERIPVRYDFQGNITGYEEKSLSLLFLMPFIQLLTTGLLFYVFKATGKAREELSGKDLNAAQERSKAFKKRVGMFVIYIATVINLLFFMTNLLILQVIPYSQALMLIFLFAFPVIMIFPPLIFLILTGQSGSRIKLPKTEVGKEFVRSDDEHWKLGMFYYNPNDPSLWVEKRFGIGYTMNFARWGAWVFMGFILLILLGSLVLPLVLH